MYDFIQTALTATIEAIALVTFIGLPAHYIVMSHIREVKSWGVPQATPAQEIKPEVKAVVTEQPVIEVVTEVVPVVEVIKEAPKVATTRKPRNNRTKKAHLCGS